MRMVYPRCCSVDVHQKTMTACVLLREIAGHDQHEMCRFGAMTGDVLELADWFHSSQVTHVAMESTGIYCKPVWDILEGPFAVVPVNAQHIKAVPGWKTGIKDCQWIADLLPRGLLRGRFVPPAPNRRCQDRTRLRTS
jgi:transposase